MLTCYDIRLLLPHRISFFIKISYIKYSLFIFILLPNYNFTNKILKAKRIYILGMRSSFTIAQYLGFYLDIILDSVHVIRMDMGDAFEQVVKINEDDSLINYIIKTRFFMPKFSYMCFIFFTFIIFSILLNEIANIINNTFSIFC